MMDLTTNNRGVTVVIGAIFMFAILIIALSIFQAEVVPSQNKALEFNHYKEVQGQLQDVRNAIISAGETNGPKSARVQLGTSYPSRIIAVQPPAARGELATETIGSGEISISGVNETQLCGIGETTSTKAIQYTPDYYYLEGTPPTTFENTVLYRQTEEGAVLYESKQRLVSGSTINLYPLVGTNSESGSGSTIIDFSGSETGSTVISGPLTLTIPTRLSPQQWAELLTDSTNHVANVVGNTSRQSAVDIQFESGVYQIQCTVVGANTNPGANPTLQIGGEGSEINPTEPGNIILEGETRSTGNQDHIVNLVLNNTGETNESIQRARINFFQDASGRGGNAAAYTELQTEEGTVTATLEFGGDYRKSNPKINLQKNAETSVSLAFYAENGNDANLNSQDWFVVSFQYSNATDGTYFVQVPE